MYTSKLLGELLYVIVMLCFLIHKYENSHQEKCCIQMS
jgi:hypothetical protein